MASRQSVEQCAEGPAGAYERQRSAIPEDVTAWDGGVRDDNLLKTPRAPHEWPEKSGADCAGCGGGRGRIAGRATSRIMPRSVAHAGWPRHSHGCGCAQATGGRLTERSNTFTREGTPFYRDSCVHNHITDI